ncbi:hypothetical protein LAZ67_1001242 [Cordylochernes scorpioides]|uniref:HORMA domain-containing protein n=1 Tax=Cordylochernes scorpioides TaxID=51811 RepID=A0ABY6JXW2_9ARAC|nr:hypothetical protein LAZ67_1001242 [Cordylochernes scorpioides]
MAIAAQQVKDTVGWEAIFPKEQTTIEKSIQFIKKLLAISISHITYLRGIFPERAYGIKKIGDFQIKILNENKQYDGAFKVVKWARSCFHALEQKYLRQIILAIYTDPNEPSNAIEAYTFEFYFNTHEAKMTCNGQSISPYQSTNFEITKKATFSLLRTLILLTESLEPLPENAFLTMKLLYFDDITPNDYHPPGFKPCHLDNFYFRDEITDIKIGQVSTPHHNFTLKVKTRKSKFILENVSFAESTFAMNNSLDSTAFTSLNKELDNSNLCAKSPIKDPETKLVNCPCKNEREEEIMVRCNTCKKYQHGICWGFTKKESVKEHICHECDKESELYRDSKSLKLENIKQLCGIRQALIFCKPKNIFNVNDLTLALKLNSAEIEKIINELKKQKFITEEIKLDEAIFIVNSIRLRTYAFYKYRMSQNQTLNEINKTLKEIGKKVKDVNYEVGSTITEGSSCSFKTLSSTKENVGKRTISSNLNFANFDVESAEEEFGERKRMKAIMPSHRRSNLSQRSNSSRVQHAYRLRETRGQNIRRLRAQSARQAAVRSLETPDPIHSRLQAHSEIYSSTRRNTRTNNFFSSVWSSMENAGFNYSVAVEYFKHPSISLGMMDSTCRFCGALRWKDESSGMFCSNGKVRLPLIDLPPEPLRSLLSGENSDSVHFLRNIRKYNSCFQMTSFGAENQTHSVTFPTAFSIQGQVYHRICSLMPSENQPSRFLQIYFMGNDDDDDDIQTDRRCQQIQGVRRNIVQGLQRMLRQHNLLVQQFKTALENLPSDAYRVVVNAYRTPPGQHPRRYNAPTANEVAVVVAGNQFGSRDIVLHQRDNLLQHVSDTHRFYDALQYPLIFWKGQEGYSFHIPQIDPNTRQPLSSKVSSMDFYGYFIMVCRNSPNVIVQFGQLFNQFLVDMYAKVESERLRYITLHQRNLRAESYIHLRDALSTDANINPNSLGQRIILPSSFVNSPRYLAEYTQDAFCYVWKFGRPDLFITFTSNPSWEELSAALLPGQKQLDRHDITARVFRQKLVKFIGALTKGQLYGATVAWMYSVEWQKRGLPHAHILVWLANKLRPTQIDSVICAEFPDPIQDPLLYNIVVKNMIHGPCGEYNPVSPCMKNSSCSKKISKTLFAGNPD